MPNSRAAAIEGVFQHPIFAPDGQVEGALIQVAGAAVQLVVARGDEAAAAALGAVRSGQQVVAEGEEQAESPKGPAEHRVVALSRLRSVDGAKPAAVKRSVPAPAYRGKVVRFNYARHGAKNGVVLDTGDFIHTRPEGMAGLRLKVGDEVAADGDAWALASGTGYVVEASTVNGKPVHRKPKDH